MKKLSLPGLTLLECLIYLGIFSIVLQGTLASFYALNESLARTEAKSSLIDEHLFLSTQIRGAVDRSISMEIPLSNGTSTSLALLISGARTSFFSQADEALAQRESDSPYSLTHVGVGVHNLAFSSFVLASSTILKTTYTASTHTSRGQVQSKDFISYFILPYE
jgi:hypothetical protein